MDIEDLTIKQARELANIFSGTQTIKPSHPALGKYCIIRTYSAGVHCGVVDSVNGKEVTLSKARRLWSWEGAFTLNSVAMEGVKSAKMSVPVADIFLTEAIEIVPCSAKAAGQLDGMKSHV